MRKCLLALLLASVSVCLITTEAEARRRHHIHHHIKIAKTKKNTEFVKVDPKKNPFLHNSIVERSANSDDSVSAFFREEQLRNQSIPEPTKTTKEKNVQVAKTCNWFTCAGGVYQQAKRWEGMTARGNRSELKQLFANNGVQPIDPTRIPWCAAFANAILRREGYQGTNSLLARSFLSWGHRTIEPKEGDIVVISRGRNTTYGHVGFFAGYEMYNGVKYVKVFGGNTGHSVQVGHFPAHKVLGYRAA